MFTLLAAGPAPFFHLAGQHNRTLGLFGFVTDITFHPAPLIVLVAGTYLYLRAVRQVDRQGRPLPVGIAAGGAGAGSSGAGLGSRPGFASSATAAASTAGTPIDGGTGDGGMGETGGSTALNVVQRWAVGPRTWPRWRTWCFLATVLALASATLSGLTAFQRSSFAIVGVQDSLLAFVAPFFLSLAAPVNLTIAVSSPERGERIRAAFTGRVARVASYPLFASVVWGGAIFGLYFTHLFRIGLDHAALWQVINLMLFATGCLFAWPMAAVDPLPKPTGHGWRMLWLLATLPFTTVVGIALESQNKPIAPGVTASELHLGAGIIWTIGGFLGLFATILVLAQWCRLEERSASKRDRILDPDAATQLAYWRASRRLAAEEAGLVTPTDTDQLMAEALALQGAPERRALPSAPSGDSEARPTPPPE